jgi:SAM-dependent methyltransferase
MNEAKLHEFMGKLVTDLSGAAMVASIVVGEELGLYRAMADGEPISADDLAKRTGCNGRLVREWLNAQAASGYVEYADGAYRLPAEQALALAVEDSPVYVAGGTTVLASLFLDKDRQVAAMRGTGAIPWGDHHSCMFSGVEKFFRPGYKNHLVSAWLPALDGVVDKLRAGAKVADVGCGHGASTVIMAQAFPKSKFHGIDFHAPSVATARTRAVEGGVADRITVSQATAQAYTERDFDLICFFDCLHDMGDPVGAARRAYEALKPDGTVLLVEPFAGDNPADNFTPIGRMYYAASTFLCTPNSLSQDVGLGLGAQAGEARLRQVFAEAGFSRFRRATETPFNLILEARK